MKSLKKSGVVLIAALIIALGTEVGERMTISGVHSLISDANARIGRPLTPVSIAGVGRRTVRRCAVGIYNC